MASEASFCSFRLGDFLFGIESFRVQEVLKTPVPLPVPLTAPWVSGLINLRGEVLTILDLKKRLGLEVKGSEKAPFCVILKDKGEWIGLMVDEIGDVVEPAPDSFEEPLPTLPQDVRRLVRGVYKLKRSLLLALDPEKVLQAKD